MLAETVLEDVVIFRLADIDTSEIVAMGNRSGALITFVNDDRFCAVVVPDNKQALRIARRVAICFQVQVSTHCSASP
jgi:hypothetical protein